MHIIQDDAPFSDIVKRGDAYFAKKHPGLTAKDLASGPNRLLISLIGGAAHESLGGGLTFSMRGPLWAAIRY